MTTLNDKGMRFLVILYIVVLNDDSYQKASLEEKKLLYPHIEALWTELLWNINQKSPNRDKFLDMILSRNLAVFEFAKFEDEKPTLFKAEIPGVGERKISPIDYYFILIGED